MAKDENDIDVEPKGKPAKAPKAAKAGGGGLPVPLIAAAVVALAGVGFGAFMFMQMNSLKAKLAAGPDIQPRGVEGEEGEVSHAAEGVSEPAEVVYDLGNFTTNTSDGKFAKMSISLKVESYYDEAEWKAFSHQKELYEEELDAFLESQAAPSEEGGKDKKDEKKGGHGAAPSSRILALILGSSAAIASEKKEAAAEPATRPEEPARPLTLAEQVFAEHVPEITDLIIEQINLHTAAQLTSADGREEFKTAVIEALNEMLDPRDGKVLELYFKELVTT